MFNKAESYTFSEYKRLMGGNKEDLGKVLNSQNFVKYSKEKIDICKVGIENIVTYLVENDKEGKLLSKEVSEECNRFLEDAAFSSGDYSQCKKVFNSLVTHVKKHNEIYIKIALTILFIAISGSLSPSLAAPSEVEVMLKKIDKVGNLILKIVRTISYWSILVVTIKDCLGEAMKGSKHNVTGIALRGAMIMAVIYYLPTIFKLMEAIALDSIILD